MCLFARSALNFSARGFVFVKESLHVHVCFQQACFTVAMMGHIEAH